MDGRQGKAMYAATTRRISSFSGFFFARRHNDDGRLLGMCATPAAANYGSVRLSGRKFIQSAPRFHKRMSICGSLKSVRVQNHRGALSSRKNVGY
jgi:hypothetical protein